MPEITATIPAALHAKLARWAEEANRPFSSGWLHRDELLSRSYKSISRFSYDWEQKSILPPRVPE
jgi:hypothetical protein